MAAPNITVDDALWLFNGYDNVSQTVAENLVAYIFGAGDRTVTGDFTVTGNILTNSIKQRTTSGLVISAASGKVGFYDKTPVTQQILATGASHTVDDVITFLQLIGLCKQS